VIKAPGEKYAPTRPSRSSEFATENTVVSRTFRRGRSVGVTRRAALGTGNAIKNLAILAGAIVAIDACSANPTDDLPILNEPHGGAGTSHSVAGNSASGSSGGQGGPTGNGGYFASGGYNTGGQSKGGTSNGNGVGGSRGGAAPNTGGAPSAGGSGGSATAGTPGFPATMGGNSGNAGKGGTAGGGGKSFGFGGASGGTAATGGRASAGGSTGGGAGGRTGGGAGGSTGGTGSGMPTGNCTEADKTLSNNGTGKHCGYTYEYWKDSGTATLVLKSDGFSVDWSGINDFLGRKGERPGSGNIVVNYNANWQPNGNAYLCVYGWMTNPLVEYYIVDSWGSWRPPGGEGHVGTLTSDGGTYDIYKIAKSGSNIQGNGAFTQYWSVRTDKKASGVITVANHINAWKNSGMPTGTFYEVSMTVEGYQSTGKADIKFSMQ
jgi:endo-1,4-beta-xylanase